MSTSVSSKRGISQVAQHDLGGRSDGMQVVRYGNALYIGHTGTTGAGTSILDVTDTRKPRLVTQWDAPANTHTHKVQVADGLLLVNHEKFPYRVPPKGPVSTGVAIYRLDDPLAPEHIAFWDCGGLGVHRIVWTGGRYAHMSATPAGYRDRIWIVLDLADPAHPIEAGRWWWPGQADDETPEWPTGQRWAAHHALIDGDRAYLGFDDAGMVILDIHDLSRPKTINRLSWDGGATHTCMPLPSRGVVIVTDEQQHDGPHAPERTIRVIDVTSDPRVIAKVPGPVGNFDELPMRYGAHNLHENRAGSYRSERLIFSTWFSAGVRVHDFSDLEQPHEVAHWVGETPSGQLAPQSNDLWVDYDANVWVTDRIGGGLAVLEPDLELRDKMEELRVA